MEHETTCVNVNGMSIYCVAKIIGDDHFRYFVEHYEFPFCSVDKPDEHGNYLARTYGGQRQLGSEFRHEDVVKWSFEIIKEKSLDYYRQLMKEREIDV
jgi:hypothetical protein